MKKTTVSLLVLFIVVGVAFAQTPTLSPKDARSMGMGGTFTAFSSGYSSFYGNPAGFVSPPSLTLADVSTWAYLNPTQANRQKIQKIIDGTSTEAETRSTLSDFITSNGFGGGAAVGLGLTGGGFAFGTFLVSDQYVHGSTLLGATVTSSNSANVVLGLGIPLIKTDKVTLNIGGDIRPFLRVDSAGGGWSFSDLLDPLFAEGGDPVAALTDQEVSAGYGLAVDVGAMLTVGSLMFGVSVRDIAPTFQTGTARIGDVLAGSMPSFTTASLLNSQVTAGAGLNLKLFPKIFEPNLYLEFKDILPVLLDGKSVISRLHAGVDMKLLDFISLRTGLNGGYFSMGAGLDLALLEIDAAFFTEELGNNPGDNPRSGIALQAALRF